MIEEQIFYSLIAAIFVGGSTGYLGSLMVTRRMALVGDALGHVALPGIAMALLYNFNVILGALASLFFGILLIWFLHFKTELHTEVLTGIIFAVSLAFAFLILPSEDLETALIGDIAKINTLEFIITVFLSSIIFLIVRYIYSKIVLMTLSEDLAKSKKINVNLNNLIYLLSVGIIIALGIKIVGSLLIGGLVIIPAAASRNLSKNLSQYVFGAVFIGIFSALSGVLLYRATGFSAGPIIILIAAMVFLISFLFKQK
ncbi:MAG: metal ABC transporter permease [Patescibacteria group bacterium]